MLLIQSFSGLSLRRASEEGAGEMVQLVRALAALAEC